ncbi:hypothetical protein L905_20760 [Agrobacterium sp. TS43]|nr:hypothetical protein L905_20760 [Agrobacterium sp. TS43]
MRAIIVAEPVFEELRQGHFLLSHEALLRQGAFGKQIENRADAGGGGDRMALIIRPETGPA